MEEEEEEGEGQEGEHMDVDTHVGCYTAENVPQGFSQEQVSEFHETHLMYACHSGDVDIVRQMLACQYGPVNLNSQIMPNKWTALMYACQAGSLQIVELLFKKSDSYEEEGKKIKVDLKNNEGDTALMVACSFDFHDDQPDIIKLLLAKGADVNLENNQGETPIELCIITEFKDGLQALLDHKGEGELTRGTLDKVYEKVLEEYDFESETIDLFYSKKNKNLNRLADLALIEANKHKEETGKKWPIHVQQIVDYAKREADKRLKEPAKGGRRKSRKRRRRKTKSISGRRKRISRRRRKTKSGSGRRRKSIRRTKTKSGKKANGSASQQNV
jgi:ankyrin repeat protein